MVFAYQMEIGPGQVLRLLPSPSEAVALRGLYLAHDLRTWAAPFVYTNFVASLDGHVAEVDPVSRRRRVPPAIANPRDWRLYLELAAQADVLLTTARHLRAVAAERHTELLALGGPDDEDLADWRAARGLPPLPRVAVLSTQFDLPLDRLPEALRRRLLLVTGAEAAGRCPPGVEVVVAGAGPPPGGREVVSALARHGLPLIYSIAGPRVLRLLLQDGVLDRLYLTVVQRLLGGAGEDTLLAGPPLPAPADFLPCGLHFDPHTPGPGGQFFACHARPATA
jgi:riboflavin biosynthesis pyrimidine reductase